MISISISLYACTFSNTKVISPSKKNPKTIETFGNQLNHGDHSGNFAKKGNSIYFLKSISSNGKNGIMEIDLDGAKNQEEVYKDEENKYNLSIHGDWIYYLSSDDDSKKNVDSNLYRIKNDGSETRKIAKKIDSYVLTQDEIYYESHERGLHTISSLDLEGGDIREILGLGHTLIGIENGWIYYCKDDGEEYTGPFRIKLDGTSSEELLDGDMEPYDTFSVKDNQLYFVKYNDDKHPEIIYKVFGKDTIILDSISGSDEPDSISLNLENNWLYFSADEYLYKLNLNEKGKKKLVYKAKEDIASFLLYDGDILLSTTSNDIYISENGIITTLK